MEKSPSALPSMSFPSNETLLVYKKTAAVPNEMIGNSVDCFIRPSGPVNHQLARNVCPELGGGSVSVPKKKRGTSSAKTRRKPPFFDASAVYPCLSPCHRERFSL